MKRPVDLKSYLKKALLIKKLLIVSIIFLVTGLILWFLGFYLIWQNKNLSFVRFLTTAFLQEKLKPGMISGITEKGIKYLLTSTEFDSQLANFLKNEDLSLRNPSLTLLMVDNSKITLKGGTGNYVYKEKKVYISNGVVITSSKGYRADLKTIIFDIAQGDIFSQDQALIFYDKYSIVGSGFLLDYEDKTLEILGPFIISENEESLSP
ncbi:putative Lpt-like OstA superfamily protein [Candidatus Hepatincolaceae symbiont of Richtersius coronifer]